MEVEESENAVESEILENVTNVSNCDYSLWRMEDPGSNRPNFFVYWSDFDKIADLSFSAKVHF